MAKVCMVEREKKRLKKFVKSISLRLSIKKQIANPETPMDQKVKLIHKLDDRSKDESKGRQRNRCQSCGRPRGYMRKFGLCRICLRNAMMKGLVPGLKKASW